MSKVDLTKSSAKEEQAKKIMKPLPPFNATKKNGKGCFVGTLTVDLRQHRIPHVQTFADPLDWVRTTIASLSPIRDELAGLKTSAERRKLWKSLDEEIRARKIVSNTPLSTLTDEVLTRIKSGEADRDELQKQLNALNAAMAAMVK